MGYIFKGTVAAIFLVAFGLFLIWQGITGNVPMGIDGKALMPKGMYIFAGVVVLILPVAYLYHPQKLFGT